MSPLPLSMARCVFVFTVTAFSVIVPAECWEESREVRLRNHLFARPIKSLPPTENNKPLEVRMRVNLLKINELDEQDGVLRSQYYMAYTWTDPRLSWNATEYDGLTDLYVHRSEIWTPEMLLHSSAKQAAYNEITPESNYVWISSDGSCGYWPRYELSATQCEVDVQWFPFDNQTCNINFHSWIYTLTYVEFLPFEKEPVRLEHYVKSDLWDVTGYSAQGNVVYDEYSEVSFELHLRRKPLYYVFNLILPCFLLALLAIFSLILQPSCGDRLGLLVTILLALSVYQIIVNDKLPSTSDVLPVIGIYFMLLVIICVAAVIVTIFVLYLHLRCENTPVTPMPAWVRKIVRGRKREAENCSTLSSGIFKIDDNHPSGRERPTRGNYYNKLEETEMMDVAAATLRQTNRRLLEEIRDQLSATERRQVEARDQSDRDEELAADWKLLAVLVDRVFSLALTVFFVVATIGIIIAFDVADK